MKKALFGLLGISVLIASLSVAYYFVIFLPQRKNKEISEIRNELLDMKRDFGDTPNSVGTQDMENRLQYIEGSLQEQERISRIQADCESADGHYSGSGVCIYPPAN